MMNFTYNETKLRYTNIKGEQHEIVADVCYTGEFYHCKWESQDKKLKCTSLGASESDALIKLADELRKISDKQAA